MPSVSMPLASALVRIFVSVSGTCFSNTAIFMTPPFAGLFSGKLRGLFLHERRYSFKEIFSKCSLLDSLALPIQLGFDGMVETFKKQSLSHRRRPSGQGRQAPGYFHTLFLKRGIGKDLCDQS